MAFYRRHEFNMTYARQYPGIGDLQEYHAAFSTFCNSHVATSLDTEQLQLIANESIAWKAFWSGAHELERGNSMVCDQCLELARFLLPTIRESRAWKRLTLKRRFGSWAYSAWDRLRFTGRVDPQGTSTFGMRTIGWWPNSLQNPRVLA
jgi:hypothetical protein